jgi:hypothetical protein
MQHDDSSSTSVNEVKAVRAANEALRRDLYAQKMIINQLQDTIKAKMHVSVPNIPEVPEIANISEPPISANNVQPNPEPMESDQSRSPSPSKPDSQDLKNSPKSVDREEEPIPNGAIGSTDPLGLEVQDEDSKPFQVVYKKKPIPKRLR